MIATAVGPYEHTGPYAESELFDTEGMSVESCPDCEHDPCVAGSKYFCSLGPRHIVSGAVQKEIFVLLDEYADIPRNPLDEVLRMAVLALSIAAGDPSPVGKRSLLRLATTRSAIRKLVES